MVAEEKPVRPMVTVGRLRLALAAAAVALLLVLAGYIGYGRLSRPHFPLNLKSHGDQLTVDSGGVTWSHTNLGVTEYTVHAATEVQEKDGRLTLHDVGIVMYGSRGDRADHIHGSEFVYDKKAGVITGVGEVFIDLAAPPKKGEPAKAPEATRVVHLKTSDLVFQEGKQLASTANGIQFETGGMTGTAVGASYDAGNGIIVLQTQVRVSGLRGRPGSAERPMVLTASHAEIDVNDGPVASNEAFLEGAKLVSATETGTQTAAALHAVVHMSSDGTPKQIDGNGNVTLTGEGRGTVTSDRMQLDLSPGGQPTAAHMVGNVRFVDDVEAKQEYGKSDDARIAFDNQGRPVHAVMTGAVEADLTAGPASRTLQGDRLELALAGGGKEPVAVREGEASGTNGATMRLVDASTRKDAKGKGSNGIVTTNVKADVLKAKFNQNGRQTELSSVDGTGRTLVERAWVDQSDGVQQWKETGTGDVLAIQFAPDAKGRSEVSRAEQRGGVRIVREALARPSTGATAKKPTGPEIEHAEGDDAVYEAAADRMTLTGQVKVSDAESALFAERVTFDRATGDGTAEGGVRVSYLQQGSTGEPVHVLAARSVGHKSTGVTQFFAGLGGNAKLWQGGSQVEAPVLDFDRTKKTLLAHGVQGSEAQAVKTVLVNVGTGAKKNGGPVRVLSRELLYTDATRQAVFRGPVRVTQQDGVMRAAEATVYLAPKDAVPTARGETARDGAPIGLGGRVDHIVAVGGVEMEQPGRKATGERLVYTESDQMSVLTGTATAPPKVTDQTQGTVTGATLRFRSGEDSVEVLSGTGSDKVRTETRMKQKD
jgi:lipopolysaccharide export system protein LptA